MIAEKTKEYEETFLSPFIAAERGYIDEVIMPHSTRRRLRRHVFQALARRHQSCLANGADRGHGR
ncbi:carboxyl transferase domain-containing protein [Roseiarcus sp.]|uniref:carboxyl transferase domain-containing protein n=1 Tax=Roseiarcus sp. TaxID=1969460 RepID=UPI003F9BE782